MRALCKVHAAVSHVVHLQRCICGLATTTTSVATTSVVIIITATVAGSVSIGVACGYDSVWHTHTHTQTRHQLQPLCPPCRARYTTQRTCVSAQCEYQGTHVEVVDVAAAAVWTRDEGPHICSAVHHVSPPHTA